MSNERKVALSRAPPGIGAGVVKRFVERGFNVVGLLQKVTASAEVAASDHVAIGGRRHRSAATAARVVETALSRFRSIDVLVNTPDLLHQAVHGLQAEDIQSLVSTNMMVPVPHPARRQAMLAQGLAGASFRLRRALARNPDPGRAGDGFHDHQGAWNGHEHLAME